MSPFRRAGALACGLLLAAGLSACGTSTSGSTGSATGTPAASTSAPTTASAVTLTDGWARSTDSMPEGFKTMTGVFGTLTNTTKAPLTITGGTSPAGMMVEMHETVKTADGSMKMQKTEGGFTLPAGGTLELKPGANHIMIMKLKGDLKIGDTVTVELATSAGPVTVTAAVRAFTGANESYAPSGASSMAASSS